MASIVSRKRKDGSTAHMAQITIKREGTILHRENRTFDRKQAASAWAEGREQELAAPGAIDHLKTGSVSLAAAIDRYIGESLKEIGRTKAQVLRKIKSYELADKRCDQIGSKELVQFATELSKTVKPQTVSNYMSHLSAIFAIAKPAWGYPLDQKAMQAALAVTKRLGTTSKSQSRNRRPTLDELDKLMQHFTDRTVRTPQALPMHRVLSFALFSTRRQEEITRIRWDDLDPKHKRVLVRDMKHPGQKQGNNTWCDLPDPALSIVEAMPKTADQIFPYSTDAISAAFTRACHVLGIEDLHFHDLRHEGVSRLFEVGLNIPHVAAVSGHRSWASLKRYTHIKQAGDRYEGWAWLSLVTDQPQAPATA